MSQAVLSWGFGEDERKTLRAKKRSQRRKKDGNGSLVRKEAVVRRIWKEYYEDLHNIDTEEQVVVHMFRFD